MIPTSYSLLPLLSDTVQTAAPTVSTPLVVVEPPPFHKIIGQTSVKSRLNFYLSSYSAGGVMPHTLFLAPKGCGKTTIASELARLLKRKGDSVAKKWFLINCSTLRSVKQFFNQVIIPHVNEKDVTLIFDEASEIPKDITMALLTMLNPNEHNRTTFSYDDYTVDIEFDRQTFVFATSESHRVFHALVDRLTKIELEEYNAGHIFQMLKKNAPQLEDDAAALMATVCRGNARSTVMLAKDAQTLLATKRKDTFDLKDWQELRAALGILPLGLSNIELSVLRLLSTRKESSLTRLSAATGLSKEALQKDVELYLQKMGLLEITTAGRSITGKGLEYLKALDGGFHNAIPIA